MAVPGIGQFAAISGAAANATYSGIGEQSKANRTEREMIRSDVKRLQKGDLGYSEAQRNQLLAGQNRVGQAQMADQMAQMQRFQAAQPGGRAGGYDTQRGQLLAGRQAATAQYNTGVEQASSQMAAQQRADILGRLSAQAARNTAFWQRQGDIAERGAEKFAGGGTAGGGGGSGYADAYNKFGVAGGPQ